MKDDIIITESNQYLTFTLGEETFAFEIGAVREVTDYTEITIVPRMPPHLKGVINLRGNVVTVIDLRGKLGMPETERTIDTCIVIAEIRLDGERMPIGVLADSVQEVVHFFPEQIAPPPKVGIKLNTEYIKAIGKRKDDFVIILNVERIIQENLEGMGADEKERETEPRETDEDAESQ